MNAKELSSIIQAAAFPAIAENVFAYSYTSLSGDMKSMDEMIAFTPRTKRAIFQDDFNGKLDNILLGVPLTDKSLDRFKIWTGNQKFALCPSYPRNFIVPESFTDEDVHALAKYHRKRRLPVITWRHPVHKSLLLRAALPKSPRGTMNQRCEVDQSLCNLLAEDSSNPSHKIAIITEKEGTNVMSDFLYKTSEKHLSFLYSSANFVYVESGQQFSLPVIQERFAKFVQSCAT